MRAKSFAFAFEVGVLAAPAAQAQNGGYFGAVASLASDGATYRARNTNNGGVDRLYAGLAAGLGAGGTRDSYNGIWDLSGGFKFMLTWDGINTLTFTSASFTKLVNGSNNGTPNTSLSGSTISYSGVGSFNALRLYGRGTATVTSLDFGSGNVAANNSISDIAQYWSLASGSAFSVSGTIAASPGGGESQRIEVGVANVVPEPSTYALLAAGLLGILVANRRRGATTTA